MEKKFCDVCKKGDVFILKEIGNMMVVVFLIGVVGFVL